MKYFKAKTTAGRNRYHSKVRVSANFLRMETNVPFTFSIIPFDSGWYGVEMTPLTPMSLFNLRMTLAVKLVLLSVRMN